MILTPHPPVMHACPTSLLVKSPILHSGSVYFLVFVDVCFVCVAAVPIQMESVRDGSDLTLVYKLSSTH